MMAGDEPAIIGRWTKAQAYFWTQAPEVFW